MPRWYDKIQATAVPLWHGMWWCHAYDEIQTTVVTRAEPHNLRLVHPTQHRGQDVCLAQHHMLSIRDDVCGYVCALLFVKFYAGGLNAAYRCKIEYGTV
eukprot:scaffold28308_cov19-Tisochrysis_lutea.AAC.4